MLEVDGPSDIPGMAVLVLQQARVSHDVAGVNLQW